ncbi:DUF1887 family protein [Clostridium tertium]|uniref:DUF1887 domain-containing protein n=1 Tax=Clostridium tertium TaxID=1559 RepID=A0A6N3CHW7_9CLOT
MKIDLLINQIDNHNEANILATKKYKPKEVIFLYRQEDKEKLKSLIDFYKNTFREIILRDQKIEEGYIEELENIININKNKEILINLTGGSRINSLLLLNIIKEKGIKSVYLDIKNKDIYTFHNGVDVVKEEFEDIELNTILKASGGEFINDNTDFSKKEDLKLFTKAIYENLELWHSHKQKLYDSNIFVHDVNNAKNIRIKINTFDKNEKQLLMKIIMKLKYMGEIQYVEDKNEINIEFKNDYLKSFIFKSGTWLEIATNNMIKEIKEIDEVKSGVMFLWNDNSNVVRNEVDVIAIKDSIPICISCKDSDKYNEDALNELEVYSKQIGGDNSYKILVATKEPIKLSVKERAKEMKINIVIFDGDEEKFKKNIKNIILKI